jgi:hypothetical protein
MYRTALPALILLTTLAGCRTDNKGADSGALGSGDPSSTDDDGDGYTADEDCDDDDAAVHPGATEICNEVDDDCDDLVDEDVSTSFYEDADADGYGDPDSITVACSRPTGHVDSGTDCDDDDDTIHPAAVERCNEIDDDCDGEIDEDVQTTWYADTDDDGYGDPDAAIDECDPPTGYVADATDCDDESAVSWPGAEEICDEQDNDCDGDIDEDVTTTYWADLDGDGFGDAATTLEGCSQPSGFASEAGDCDDTDSAVNPSASELCNGIDDNCDTVVDESSALDASIWYADTDLDGYGDPSADTTACDAPSGTVADNTDCDDTDAAVNPAATEVCNGYDDDCDALVDDDDSGVDLSTGGTWYADTDLDGYGDASVDTTACTQPSGTVTDATDCDDTAIAVNPGATEVCNGIDDDCDTLVDDDDSDVDLSTGGTWYADTDTDGYGDAAAGTTVCTQPSGTVSDATDCDDTAIAVNPGATEVCNSIDDDCDALVDDDDTSLDTSTATTWYADSDGDSYGDSATSSLSCSQPSGTVGNTGDCDDTEALAWTGATEVCDTVDNNCDGTVDELVCIDVSNVDPTLLEEGTTHITVSASATVDTDTGAISGLRAAGTGDVSGIWFEVETQSSGPDLGVFVFDGLTVASGVTLTVQGSNGLVILSSDDVDFAGTLDADGDAGTHGQTTSGPRSGGSGTAGGTVGGNGSNNAASGATSGSGTSAGSAPSAGIHYGNGGGGGGHCYGGGGGMGDRPSRAGASGTSSAGGGGGYGAGDGGRGGDGGGVHGSATLEPLTAGAGGGGGISDTDYNPNGAGGGGGGGGGAVQVTVDGTLTLTGAITADGGAGGDAYGGGGGGASGGSVLLEALTLDLSGTVSSVAGGGGDGNVLWSPSSATGGSAGGTSSMGGGGGQTESGGGGGGSGWIYLRYLNGTSTTGSFAPALTSACAGTASM